MRRKLRALLSLRVEALPRVGGQKKFKHAAVSWPLPFSNARCHRFHREWATRQEPGQRRSSRLHAALLQSATTSTQDLDLNTRIRALAHTEPASSTAHARRRPALTR